MAKKKFLMYDEDVARRLAESYGGTYSDKDKILIVPLSGSELCDFSMCKRIEAYGGIPEEEIPDVNDPEYAKHIHSFNE